MGSNPNSKNVKALDVEFGAWMVYMKVYMESDQEKVYMESDLHVGEPKITHRSITI